jgi:hypothetical protein
MPISFKGFAAAPVPTSATTQNVVPVPGSVVNNNFMLLFGANTGSWPYNTPTGWTLLDQDHDDAGTNGDQTGAVFWRIASNEPASYTLVGTGSASATVAAILAYSGVDISSPIRSHTIKEIPRSPSSTPVSSAAPDSLSPVDPTDVVVHGYAYGSHNQGTGRSLAYPSTGAWTQRGIVGPTQIGGSGAGRFAAGLLFIDKPSGTDLPAATSNQTGGWSIMSIALKAMPVSPAPNPAIRKLRHLLVR